MPPWSALSRVLLFTLGFAAIAPARPPNILWLIGENLSLDLGCYGAADAPTPRLDALAAEGMRFTGVIATNPACAPSRSAFFTGCYQTSTGTHPMRSHRDDDFRLPPGIRPVTHWLHDAGYVTANVATLGDRRIGTAKLDLNFVHEGPIYDLQGVDWSALPAGRPFFAVVNSLENEYDIYDRQTWKKERVPWVGEDDPSFPSPVTPDQVTPPPYYPDHPVVREEWARYGNSVHRLDQRVGWILDRLREDGRDDDTVVLFFGDNGRLEPRGIHWCHDSGLRVPFLLRWPANHPAPARYRPGTTSDQLLSLLDLTAFTLAAAGIPLPPGMQGRRFLGPEADPPRVYAFAARDRIDETEHRIRSVHDARFHYIRTFSPGPTYASLNRYKEKCFPILPLMRRLHEAGQLHGPPRDLMERRGPCEELYDLSQDPHEIRNLAGSALPEHRDALARLRAALDTWITETGDLGVHPEPRDVVAPFAREMHDWFGTPSWAQP
jgi:arylsulfatase A-like enzyme